MCSLGDDNFDDIGNNIKYMPQKIHLPFSEQKCNKCREDKPCILLRSKDRYCKSCFISGTTHKFKGLLGKHKLIRPNDRVLVVHTGGHCSTALLHFIKTGLDLDNFKKLRFHPIVLFIEDSFHLTVEQRKQLVASVDCEARHYDFEIYFASLADLISSKNVTDIVKDDWQQLNISKGDKLQMNERQRNKTNKNDYVQTLRRQFLVDCAKHLNCKIVFVPEISIDIAAQLLTNISLGRGSHIPLDTGFCDSRDSEVKILRPLRNFDSKELAFYNHFNRLEPVTYKPIDDNIFASTQNLTRKFVNDLQANYPATITTVIRTGDKLSLSGQANGTKCLLCKVPLVNAVTGLSSAESTNFSHWVSTQVPDYTITPQQRYERSLETFTNQICDQYCYSCSKLQEFIIK